MQKRGKECGFLIGLMIFLVTGWVPSVADVDPQIRGTRIIPLPEAELPRQICVEKDRVYVVDKQNVLVYDLETGRLRTRIGKIGQGPGEFDMGPIRLTVFPDRLVIKDIQKIEIFTLEGAYSGEIREPESMGIYPFLPVGKNFVGFPIEISDDGSRVSAVGCIYDNDVKLKKKFYAEFPVQGPPPPPPPGSHPPAEKTDVRMINEYQDCLVSEEKIYVADSRKGLSISVFDENGNVICEILHPVDKMKVPKSFVEEVIREQKASKYWDSVYSHQNPIVPEYFPAFVGFKIDGQRIYALTAAQKDGLYEVIVMDLEGRVLEKSFRFPIKPNLSTPQIFGQSYDLEGDKFFWIAYNDAKEIYELHIR